MTQFAFQKTGDANYPRYLRILVMGPPKSGKTTFLSTAPNVVVAACEAGLMSIAHLNVPYIEVDSVSKLETLAMIIENDEMRKKAAASLGLPDIETVAIDTMDALQDLMKTEILSDARRTQFQREDWGTLKERMTAVIKKFTTLPVNLILTVHTEVTQDENGKQIYAPNLQGAIKNDIAGLVDFSLKSFRQKETDVSGVSAVKYYLKNEGDEQNPHLGNRAAGRVPETCDPDFKVLHNLVFSAIKAPAPLTAQTSPVVVEVPTPVETAAPTGKPAASDPADPINAAGLQMLTKEYASAGVPLPADVETWTVGKARTIAKFFMAWKKDVAVQKSTKEELVDFLIASEAYDEKDEVTSVETEEVTEDAAQENVEKQLGGVLIGVEIKEDATCEICGKQVDDLDIAKLGWNRLHKVLCVSDYKTLIRK